MASLNPLYTGVRHACANPRPIHLFFFCLTRIVCLFILFYLCFFLRCRPDWASASTYFIPEGPAEPEPVAAWIIAVSSVAGILLLSAAIFLLHGLSRIIENLGILIRNLKR